MALDNTAPSHLGDSRFGSIDEDVPTRWPGRRPPAGRRPHRRGQQQHHPAKPGPSPYLKEKIDDFEGVETDLKASIKDLRRVLDERGEMLNFMSKGGCEAATTATSVVGKAMVAWN
ncbi:thymidylate synthase [Striga asiatica]|uniref:Thymidylate synthase n=1 Tax=Striga asiatica TaxID=4170 RepID=A0A5A7NZZ7_STRAF|nr:thymidylate synthase [Striga asiatica]